MSFSTSPSIPTAAWRWLAVTLAAWPGLLPAQTATPTLSTLVAISGSQIVSAPVLGPDGALYGTTSAVNIVTGGLIYRLEPDGSRIQTVNQLALTDGRNPYGGLLLGTDGLLYGTTSIGSASESNTTGTVFRVAPDGDGFTVLHRFASFSTVNDVGNPINTDGSGPETEMIELDGWLYGVARTGGANGNGVVFRLRLDGSAFSVLHEFGATTSEEGAALTNGDGIGPVAPLVACPSVPVVSCADGYLYGTTLRGGPNSGGTVYRLRPDGSEFSVVHAFTALVENGDSASTNEDGANPIAGLTDGGNGRLYGVAREGGSNGLGTLFELDPSGGLLTALHHFDGTRGSQPSGELLLAANGLLYGTTASGGTSASGSGTLFGTVFSFDRADSSLTVLHSFAGSDGSNPTGRLLQLDASTLIGVTQAGGRCSQGTVFRLSLTGQSFRGVTNCGRRNNNSGGGAVLPSLLLLLGAAGLARRFAAR